MGTNYYLVKPSIEISIEGLDKKIKSCEILDNREEIKFLKSVKKNMLFPIDYLKNIIHLGKKSKGWKFLADHNNYKYFEKNNYEDYIDFLNRGYIMNNYEKRISLDEFLKISRNIDREGKLTQHNNSFIMFDIVFSHYTDFS